MKITCLQTKPASDRTVQSAFSLIELLTVIAIIGVLAGLGVSLAALAKRKGAESRIRAELGSLTTAIESYKADFNQYPPDNLVTRTSAYPAVNPLYYELVGTIVSNRSLYHTSDRSEAISSATIKNTFNRSGFVNAVDAGERPKNYLPNLKPSQKGEILNVGGVDVDILQVPVRWPSTMLASAPLKGFTTDNRILQINPWQYVATNPTNNPGQFDLWAEVMIGKERRVIGNWRE